MHPLGVICLCMLLLAAVRSTAAQSSCAAVDPSGLPPGYAIGTCVTTGTIPNGASCQLTVTPNSQVTESITIICQDGQLQFEYGSVTYTGTGSNGGITVSTTGSEGNAGGVTTPTSSATGSVSSGSCVIPVIDTNFAKGTCSGTTLANGQTCEWVGDANTQEAGFVITLECKNGEVVAQSATVGTRVGAAGTIHVSVWAVALAAVGVFMAM